MKSRSLSPYLKKSTDPDSNADILITGQPKIQRIRCRRNYNAEVTDVVSPSEIWIRILNNISDKIIIPTSDAPMLEDELDPDKYVLTPTDEDTLVRGRIIAVQDDEKVLIRLIDHGPAVLRDKNAVFKMASPKDELYTYPWQSKVVMLHGVKPKNKVEWTAEETEAIKRVLSGFDYVYVKPTLADYFHTDNDREAASVSLIGMNGPLQQSIFDAYGCRIAPESSGIDIAELYNFDAFSTPQYIIDGRDQQFYDYPAKFENAYRLTYKEFNITPNPNNTYREERVELKEIKTEEDKANTASIYVNLAPTADKNVNKGKMKAVKSEVNTTSDSVV